MSLLNDALKAAEQRQNRPQVSRAYTGQAQAQPAPRSKMPLLAVVLVLMVAAVAVAWWWLAGQEAKESPVPSATQVAEPAEPQPPAPVQPVPAQAEAPVAEPEPEAIKPAAEVVKLEPAVVAQKPEATRPAPEPRVTEPEPKAQEPAEAEPVAQKTEPDDTAPDTAAAPVKQQRETPEAIDQRTSRELGRLLASGRTTEAEQRLTAITANQPAQASREVFAREMLVQQMPARALEWLPQTVTSEHANLRLLRARAQLEQGDLDQAVATLNSRVPPIANGLEYRITLATLLQQAGDTEESAGHWSELIAYDNNQPTWWLGLAMALDAGGRTNSAVRAYSQAATMPELSENLANYARQRLQALQAGS